MTIETWLRYKPFAEDRRTNNHKDTTSQAFLFLLHYLSVRFGLHTFFFNLVNPFYTPSTIYKLKHSYIVLNLAKIWCSKNNFLYCIVQCKVDHLMHSSCSRVNIQISFKKRLIQMEHINATPITLFDLLTILFTLIEQISFKFQAASRTMELKLIGDKLTQMAEKKIEKDLLLLLPIHRKCRSFVERIWTKAPTLFMDRREYVFLDISTLDLVSSASFPHCSYTIHELNRHM